MSKYPQGSHKMNLVCNNPCDKIENEKKPNKIHSYRIIILVLLKTLNSYYLGEIE